MSSNKPSIHRVMLEYHPDAWLRMMRIRTAIWGIGCLVMFGVLAWGIITHL